MHVNQIFQNLSNVGGLLTVVAIVASWATFRGQEEWRGRRVEKLILMVSDISIGLCWVVLALLLVYSLFCKHVFFKIAYGALFIIVAVQIIVFLYFFFIPFLISERKREEAIDKYYTKHLKK